MNIKQRSLVRARACAVATGILVTFTVSVRATTFTASSTADTGLATWRSALVAASSCDTINFSLPANSGVALASAELLINKSLTITGLSRWFGGSHTAIRR